MADLIATAQSAGSFKTLMTAVKAAELEETLKSPGPYTLLAPTDEAFEQLPAGALNELLQHTHKLKQVLLYHVIFGDVRSDDLLEINEAPTVEGGILAVEQVEGGVRVNDSKVLQMDIMAENGVIHAIDAVLMPVILE